MDSVFSQNDRHSRCLVLLKSLLYELLLSLRSCQQVSVLLDRACISLCLILLCAALCCFNPRSQPERFTYYSIGNVSDGASEFKGRHNMVCQILACLVEMMSCVEINVLFSVLVHVGL